MKVRARGRIDAVRVLARIDKVLGHGVASGASGFEVGALGGAG